MQGNTSCLALLEEENASQGNSKKRDGIAQCVPIEFLRQLATQKAPQRRGRQQNERVYPIYLARKEIQTCTSENYYQRQSIFQPIDALKIVVDFQYVRLQRNEKILTVNAPKSAQLCPGGSESSIELPLPDNHQ